MCTAAHCMYTYVLYTTDVCMNTTQHGTAQNTNRTDSEESELHSLHIYRIRYLSLSLPLSLALSAYVWWICFGTLLPKLSAYVFVSSVCARAMESNGNRVFNYSANILTHCSSVPLSYTSHTRTKKESGRASKRGKNIYTKTSRL